MMTVEKRGVFLFRATTPVLVAAFCLASVAARADEGMWTYDHVPAKQLEARYGFVPSQAWLDHLRLSSVDMYASASFVSKDGLILTNHHVALGAAQRLSTPEHNYVRDGFVAQDLGHEIPVPGMTIKVLESIEDVTPAVNGGVKPGASPAEARAQREAQITSIENDCMKKTGLKGQVVTLYGGAKYALYRYKEYSDVRLVFIPELQAAFFGGDDDNFTYPRYDLDMAMLRAYENGKPAHVENYLKVNPEGAKDGDLVFVSGHPGRTDRLQTLAMLEYARDAAMPFGLNRMKEVRALLKAYSSKGPEEARRARTVLYFMENSIKSMEGELRGLNDPELMAKKRSQEDALRLAVEKSPELSKEYGDAWKNVESAIEWARGHENDLRYKMDVGMGGRGLLGTALQIVRYSDEVSKPDQERLEGYHDAELPDLLRWVQAPAPVYKDLEEVTLTYGFEQMLKGLGPDDPFVKAVLQGQQPGALAKSLLEGTKLDDPAFRKKLLENKGKAVAKCDDPMITLARRMDPVLRETRKAFRDHVEAVEEAALTKVAKAGFAVYGTDTYPDATGTLRLAFGKVAGYPQGTTLVPPFTTFYGIFDRAYGFGNKGDFSVPARTAAHQADIDLKTPLNFVCTADITGGNSGSPVVDREGRLVGLVFDGNAQSHPNTFVYDEYQARCVAVDVRAILEALRKIYGAGNLADEMLESSR
jgi:hypothetical protein